MSQPIDIMLIIELKKVLDAHFGIKLHLHDTCGGQYFSVINLTPAGKEYIINYFESKNYRVIFSSDEEFYIEDIHKC